MLKSPEVQMFIKRTSGIIQGRHPAEAAREGKHRLWRQTHLACKPVSTTSLSSYWCFAVLFCVLEAAISHSVLVCMRESVCKHQAECLAIVSIQHKIGAHILEKKCVKVLLQVVLGHENWQSSEICKCGHSCKER